MLGVEGSENSRADVLVIDAPEPVEAQHALVVLACSLHLVPVLVPDAVVDGLKVDLWQEARHRVDAGLGAVTWQEDAGVVELLDQSVRRVAVGLDGGETDTAIGAV